MIKKFGSLSYHVVGLVVGASVGVLIGLVVSDKADQFEVLQMQEEVVDGPEKA